MPKMEWDKFQHDHHRPHLLIVTMEGQHENSHRPNTPDLERLALRLGTTGNYAFKMEGTTFRAAFENQVDAQRFAVVFRPRQTTRETEWASVAQARMDDATFSRIAGILRRMRLKKRKFTPR